MIHFWAPPGSFAVNTWSTQMSLRRLTRWAAWLVYTPVALLAVCAIVEKAYRRDFEPLAAYVACIAMVFVSNVWFTAILRYRLGGAVDNLMLVMAAVFLANRLRAV